MYYLLENNRIVDSENEDVYVNEYQGHKWLHKNNEHKTCLGFIKKQSENVFDLIENGDLAKFRYLKTIELCDFQDNENNFVNYLKDCLNMAKHLFNYKYGIITVIAESYLGGRIFRYGNYQDDEWQLVGTMLGFA